MEYELIFQGEKSVILIKATLISTLAKNDNFLNLRDQGAIYNI